MSKENADLIASDLEEGAVAETKEVKAKKEQTPEDVAQIEAGVAKIKEFGVSEKFAQVMELATAWNGTDKDVLAAAKESLIKTFGGSDSLKDYVDGEFQKELSDIQGTAKVASILNNIKSFYARRAGAVKVKTLQVNILGTLYSVSAEYFVEIGAFSKEEKRELLLAHPNTTLVTTVAEIL